MTPTGRQPLITVVENAIPINPQGLVVDFDAWIACRSGAMACKVSPIQWILTTGIPLESVISVRDSTGGFFDCATLGTLNREYQATKPVEPLQSKIKGTCEMPSLERWHCMLSPEEEKHAEGPTFNGQMRL